MCAKYSPHLLKFLFLTCTIYILDDGMATIILLTFCRTFSIVKQLKTHKVSEENLFRRQVITTEPKKHTLAKTYITT
jgi:hypothetical protein